MSHTQRGDEINHWSKFKGRPRNHISSKLVTSGILRLQLTHRQTCLIQYLQVNELFIDAYNE